MSPKQIPQSVLIVFCLLLAACSTHTPDQHQQNQNSENTTGTKLSGKARAYFKEKTGDLTYVPDDYIEINRRRMADFAEDRIRLGGGFKYRVRPSKTPSWRYLAIGSTATQYIVDLNKKKRIKKLRNAGGGGTDWHPDKPWLVGMGEGVLRITNVETGKIIKKWKPKVNKRNIQHVHDIRFFPDGERMLFTLNPGNQEEKSRIEIWNVAEDPPRFVKLIKRPHNEAFGKNIIFSPDGNYFSFDQRLTPKGKEHITFWSTESLEPVRRFPTSEKEFVQLSFHRLFGRTILFAKGPNFLLEMYILNDDFRIEKRSKMKHKENRGLRDYEVTDLDGLPIEMEERGADVLLYFLNRDLQEGLNDRTMFADIVPGNRVGDATFGPNGEKIYLATGSGDLWIYSIKKLLRTYRRFTNIEQYYKWKARKKFGNKKKKEEKEEPNDNHHHN